LIRQARRIEEASSASAKRRPEGKTEQGEDAVVDDAGLQEMILRWKAASRLAAEELFGLVRERMEGMGGVKAWRERQREVCDDRGGGFGFEGQEVVKGGEDGEAEGDGERRRDGGEDDGEEEEEKEEDEEEEEETVSYDVGW
jgi:Swi5-dependent recombination DNA repair protein 1